MKHNRLLLAVLALMPLAIIAQSNRTSDLKTVGKVDLKRYTGKWYEIARYPNKFQKQCVGNVTAQYTLKDNGRIEVRNQCAESDGTTSDVVGEAKVSDKDTNAKLKVRFAPKAVSFLPFVWANYWIIDLGDDYEYSVVGEPKREYLWILSRNPQMSDEQYQKILRKVEEMGFLPGKLQKTPQNMETLKGGVSSGK